MSERKPAPPWLQKHYEEKRQRTIRLVKAAVDHLVNTKQTVTLEAICRASLDLDPESRGIKKSAILENPEAHAYYRAHSSSYRTAQARKQQGSRKDERKVAEAHPLRLDPNRNVDRARYRYLQMTKSDIVKRLLSVEQAYAEVHQQLARLQFQLLEQEHQQAEEQRQLQRQSKRKGGKAESHEGTEGE